MLSGRAKGGIAAVIIVAGASAGLGYYFQDDLEAQMAKKKWILPTAAGLVGLGVVVAGYAVLK